MVSLPGRARLVMWVSGVGQVAVLMSVTVLIRVTAVGLASEVGQVTVRMPLTAVGRVAGVGRAMVVMVGWPGW